uniref:Si:ch211-128m15.3 n=1 Tax=Cyprinus carpio TaxID=7962 RepID=A0A8C1M277_CYPCA
MIPRNVLQDALGADFITVELDTQPIEYVVKWADVGSKFTITCVKKDLDETSDQMVKVEPDETFFVPYDTVFPECDEAALDLIATHEEEVGSESDFNDHTEAGNSQLCEEEDISDICWEREVSHARAYNCRFCGKSYSHSSSLARHLHVHSDRSKKALQCNLCGVRCNGKRLLAIHKKCHKTKRLHTCNTCGKTFNHSSSLSRHRLIHKKGLDKNIRPKRTVSSGEREKQYQCFPQHVVFGTYFLFDVLLSKYEIHCVHGGYL